MADTTRTPGSNPKEPIAFDERTRRVLELRRQVRAGMYRPDPELVAQAILSEWFAMGLELERETPVPSAATHAERQQLASRFVVEKSAVVLETSSEERTA